MSHCATVSPAGVHQPHQHKLLRERWEGWMVVLAGTVCQPISNYHRLFWTFNETCWRRNMFPVVHLQPQQLCMVSGDVLSVLAFSEGSEPFVVVPRLRRYKEYMKVLCRMKTIFSDVLVKFLTKYLLFIFLFYLDTVSPYKQGLCT